MNMTRKTFLSSAVAATVAPNLFAGAKRVVKVGAVGCGWRGDGAVKDIFEAGKLLGVEIKFTAFADFFRDRAAKQCRKWGIDEKNAFGGASGYKEVLKSGCDIVILATPPIFRARQDNVLDPNRPWGQRMVAIGDGELDFRKLRDRLDAINYNGWVSVESDFRSDADHALILRRFISGDPVWPK